MEKELLFFRKFDAISKKFIYEGGLPNTTSNKECKIIPKLKSIEIINLWNNKTIIEILRSEIINITIENGKLIFSINRDNQEHKLYFISKHKDSLQIITDIKYNVENFWKYIDNSVNPQQEIDDFNQKYVQENHKLSKGCLVILLLIAIPLFFLMKNSDEPNPCLISEKYINNSLYFPDEASMSFLDCRSEEKGNGVYRVLRKIKAKNAFGISQTYYYEVLLKYNGGEPTNPENWELTDIRYEKEK